MSAAPRLLDLFSGAGGAAMGYARAGFEVTGVDIRRQRRYPFTFVQADALEYLAAHGHEYDAIHASPPCQRYTRARHLPVAQASAKHNPDLVSATRDALVASGKPYVIENVPLAPLVDPIQLCGSQFGLVAADVAGEPLQLRRHRRFESNVFLLAPGPCRHLPGVQTASVIGTGGGWTPEHRGTHRQDRRGGYVPAKSVCAQLMGIDWMLSKREIAEAIPPAYTQWLGGQLVEMLAGVSSS